MDKICAMYESRVFPAKKVTASTTPSRHRTKTFGSSSPLAFQHTSFPDKSHDAARLNCLNLNLCITLAGEQEIMAY
jgi:hypothetical protein